VVGGGERASVADGDEDRGGGPDPDAGHRDQERGKRVGLQQGTELALQRAALVEDLGQLAGEGRDDDRGRPVPVGALYSAMPVTWRYAGTRFAG
jgi:hypothetical protein